uniref:Cytochrome P450 3638G1 n=1 Tax=Maconellicoccus hirsutus TaxID=177089 RepID=A0AAT9UTM4_MACHI
MANLINMLMNLDWRNQIMITLCTVLCGVIIFHVSRCERRTNRMMPMLKSFNQLPTLPLIGSVYLLLGGMRERMEKLLKIFNEYELPLVGWLMHIPVVCVGKSDDIQTILSTTRSKDLLGIFERIVGNSLITLQGEKWRRSRRTVTPAFSPSMFQRYFPVFNEYSALLMKKLEPLCDTDEVFDIRSHVFTMNLNSITKNMSGYEIETSSDESLKIVDAIYKALRMESMRFTVPLLFPKALNEIYLYLSGKYKIYDKIYQLPKNIVREKLAKQNEKRGGQQDEDENTGAGSSKTLIDSLLKLHTTDANFTQQHIQDEILGIITAGYESTAITVCTILLMLAMHPKAQETVHDEIETIFGDSDREVQMEDVKNLVYMEQCINETLRKFPIIPLTLRIHDENIVLSDNRIIPAGCRIFLAFYASHHDKAFFPNADNWDPEHFSAERTDKCKNAFFPFGSGLRLCVGAKYAMMTMKTQLVHLLRRYRFTTHMKIQDVHLILDLLMRNDSGYWLKLHSR